MASAAGTFAGLFSSNSRRLLRSSPRKVKANQISLFPRRTSSDGDNRLSKLSAAKRTIEFTCFASNSNQQPEDTGVADMSDETIFIPDDASYVLKLLAGSVGGGAAVKYGSVLFPEITKPNLVQALVMISLPVLVAAIILIKESFSGAKSKDLF